MLGTPVFLGFSMLRRTSRRRLVAVTYAILLALMAVIIVVSRSAPRRRVAGFASSFAFAIAFNGVSLSIFGRLAKDTVLPLIHGGEMTSLGLTPQPRREDDLDERELAVRNAAYFKAYRAVAVYSIIAWMALICSFDLSASIALSLMLLLFIPLLTMTLTLPPAVILWTEPDVPEEAKV
jgi:hypothetical protein